MKPYAVTWHEAEGKQSTQEIASGYKFFIAYHRDVFNFIFWADNCSAQNKNWYIFTLVNAQDMPTLNSIILKYFERGHTFISADSYHHSVEKSMKAMKNVYDYGDFVKALEMQGQAMQLNHESFYNIPRGSSESRRTKNKPKLDSICTARFLRGSTHILWKESFDEKTYKFSEFLVKKRSDKILTGIKFPLLYPGGCRGIPESRKDEIIKNLCPLIPVNRLLFWKNLKTNQDIDNGEGDQN